MVLQLDEFEEDIRGNDVGPGAEQLPELDESGAQFVEHLPDVATALAGRYDASTAPARDEMEQAVALEKVAEPVPDRDLRNLPHPLDVADTGYEVGVPGLRVRHYHPHSDAFAVPGPSFLPRLCANWTPRRRAQPSLPRSRSRPRSRATGVCARVASAGNRCPPTPACSPDPSPGKRPATRSQPS